MTACIRCLRLTCALPAALLLGACAVGPDYQPPSAAELPATASFEAGASPAFARHAPPDEWWRLYDDPVLDAAVQEALGANTDLRAAGANLLRAEAVLRGATGGRFPETTLTAGASSGRTVFAQNPDFSFEDTVYQAGLDVAYQLDLLGRVARTIEAAGATAEAAQATYDSARITIVAETARAYARACAAGLQLDAARRSVELQSESHALTERLREAGRGTALDVARASALLAQTRAGIPTLEAARRGALYRLAVLMGRPPADYPAQAADCSDPPALDRELPVGDGAGLLSRRPDVRRAERELAAATAGIGVAVADLYPRVSIGASVGTIALDAGDLGASDSSQWSLGPLLSWTVPNRSAARARVAAAEADAAAKLAAFDGIWLDALRETEAALTGYANELDRVAMLAESHGYSAEAARLARLRFEAGRVSFLDVLQAELALAEADMALARSRSRLAELQIAVFLALGGGWSDQPR